MYLEMKEILFIFAKIYEIVNLKFAQMNNYISKQASKQASK